MKYLIASDIHGSAYYCKLLAECFGNSGAEKLLLLGDLLYHGARNPLPRDYNTLQCAEILNELKTSIVCVKGNCDSEVDQMVLDFPVQADFFLFELGGRAAIATHGHNPPALQNQRDMLFNGHFHVPAFEQREDCLYVNCGSVSIPKENSPHSCILAEGDTLAWIDLETGKIFRKENIAPELVR